MTQDEPAHRFETLAGHLHALGSPTRLALLSLLRTPKAVSEIRVRPSQPKGHGSASRALSRQGVTRHLEQLVELGVVSVVKSERFPRGEGYVLNRERLFADVDELRSLARLAPSVDVLDPGRTLVGGAPAPPALPTGPRLLVAYGDQDGVALRLDGEGRTAWTIGRAPDCELRLAYDPFLSARNTRIERARDGFAAVDLGGRNGTRINFASLAPNGSAPLRPSDVLTVGHTNLVFQA